MGMGINGFEIEKKKKKQSRGNKYSNENGFMVKRIYGERNRRYKV